MTSRTLRKQLEDLTNRLEGFQKIFLNKVADDLVSRSPVDTGAYVESNTISTSRSAGRSRSSAIRKTSPNPEQNRELARRQLAGDIAGIPNEATKVYITNRSPHTSFVEARHKVFGLVKQDLPRLAKEAYQEAKK